MAPDLLRKGVISTETTVFQFTSLENGTCELTEAVLGVDAETLFLPERSPEGETVVGIAERFSFRDWKDRDKIRSVHVPASYRKIDRGEFYHTSEMTEWVVDPKNEVYCSVDGVLFSRDRRILIACPAGRRGEIQVPAGTREIGENAFSMCHYVKRIVLPESIEVIGPEAFYMISAAVCIPGHPMKIHERAFVSEWDYPSICAPRNSDAHRFALRHYIRFIPSAWDHEGWKQAFEAAFNSEEFHSLRRQVFQDTVDAVKNAGYKLPSGRTVALELNKITQSGTRFYSREFHAAYFPLREPVEVRVIPADCLDTARSWAEQGIETCVLNLANRRNPGGDVIRGDGAQEEYLFRCSDYFRSLYRYAPYAGQYGLDHADNCYPMERTFGGIYTPCVTVFRGNEAGGYAYLEKPFCVNMIAVAGINRPELEYTEDGEERIAPFLVEPTKNKIRTILRIAQDNGQRNLILGALGCGAFRNPPKHIAELFRDVLCEDEFAGAFRRVVFAVKTDHNSGGSRNFDAFLAVLDGLRLAAVPASAERRETNLAKMAVSRDGVALLRKDGSVRYIDLYSGRESIPDGLSDLTDLAAGFHAVFGLHRNGEMRVWNRVDGNDTVAIPGRYPGGNIVAAEGHAAILTLDGDVVSTESRGFEFEYYAEELRGWHDMAEIDLAFSMALGLRRDGTVVATRFPWAGGKAPHPLAGTRAVQVAVNDAYYGSTAAAALLPDGTVRAYFEGKLLESAQAWREIVRIACCDAVIFALDQQGVLYCVNRLGTQTVVEDIQDFACGLCDVVALDFSGRLHRFDRGGKEEQPGSRMK